MLAMHMHRPHLHSHVSQAMMALLTLLAATVALSAKAAPGVDAQVNKFWAMLDYETGEETDRQLGRQIEPNGQYRAYSYGLVACSLSAKNDPPDIIAKTISKQAGFTGSGAQAIVAAAVRVLCPSQNFGYLTHFDRQVQAARNRVHAKFGVMPEEIATGRTAKAACSFMERNRGADGLSNYILKQSGLVVFAADGSSAYIGGVGWRTVVYYATRERCPVWDLNPQMWDP